MALRMWRTGLKLAYLQHNTSVSSYSEQKCSIKMKLIVTNFKMLWVIYKKETQFFCSFVSVLNYKQL